MPYPTWAPPLHTLALGGVWFPYFPLLPNTIQRLFFQGTWTVAANRSHSMFENMMRSRTENLEHLALRGIPNLSPPDLIALLDHCRGEDGEIEHMVNPANLKSLALSESTLTVKGLFGEKGLCASPRMITDSLTSLDISTTICTDDDIETLLTLAKSIEVIDISSTRITGASIKMLADGLPNLRHLKANNCPKISSRDAVAYAENKGILVSCRMMEHTSGKKVRMM
jgi:F-box/TPR repeat protein Pof3